MKTFKLDQFPKIDAGFKIPENYFDDLDAKIMGTLSQNEQKVIPIFKKSNFWVAAAATLVIGFSVFYNFNNFSNNPTFVTNEEYLALDENLHTEDLALYLSDNDVAALEQSLNTYDMEIQKITNENF